MWQDKEHRQIGKIMCSLIKSIFDLGHLRSSQWEQPERSQKSCKMSIEIVICVPTCYSIAWKRSKCKWTLRQVAALSISLRFLLPNPISQRRSSFSSSDKLTVCSDWIWTFLTFGILKGSRWHGRSKRIWAIFREKPTQLWYGFHQFLLNRTLI